MQPVFHMAGHGFAVVRERVIVAAGMAACADALGDFVFMVGKLQIRAAAVDVKRVAEQVFAHRRAFDVPARAALSPRAFPCRFARFGGFPQHKIERVALEAVHFHALARAQIIERFAGELAVGGKLAHGVIHVAVGGGVGFAFLNQRFDHGNHLRDVFRSLGFKVGAQHAQRVGIFVHGGDKTRGQLADGLAVFSGAGDDFVVDVGDVAHISERITAFAQPAGNHVKYHHHAGMAEMAVVVNSHAAHVHAHVGGVDGGEGFFLAGEGVVEV